MSKLVKIEARLYLRDPMIVLWGLAFPVLLLAILGSIPSFREHSKDFGGLRVIDVYVPIVIAFVLAMLGISGLASVLASYREQGVLRRLATTPVGPRRLIAAQLAVNAALIATVLVALLAVARIAFGVALPGAPLAFLVSVVLAAAALLAIGVFVAAVAPTARVATGIGTVLFFPLMFLAGLWIPRDVMPAFLRDISDFTPLGAAVGALQQASAGDWPQLSHLAVLAGYAVILTVAATRLFRWE